MDNFEDSDTNANIIHNGDLLLSLQPFYEILPVDHPNVLSPYPCLHCRRRCDTIQQLDLHRVWHRRENQCSICNKTFATFEIFSGHVRKHYVDATKDYSVNNKIRENPVICNFCPEKFTTLRNLQLHTKLYADSYINCSRCDRYLPACHTHNHPDPQDSELEQHSGSNAFLRKYYLNNLREETFKTVGSLLDGKPKIHSSLSTYTFHTRAEHPVKPFNCHICKLRFGERSVLEQHLNNHYTEHVLLYNSTSDFPQNTRLKLKEQETDSHAYALTG